VVVFVAVAGWQCFLDRSAPHHQEAVAIIRRAASQRQRLLTTNAVVNEVFALLRCRYRLPLAQSMEIVDAIRRSRLLEIAHIDATLEEVAWKLLRAHPERQWSLVDATSFAVMRATGVNRALTTNQHFSEAGFTRLLV
jgi:predicted nucleic acid-binding protein